MRLCPRGLNASLREYIPQLQSEIVTPFPHQTQPTEVTSCGRRLTVAPHAFGELEESRLDDPFQELRTKLSTHGYLFFRNLIDRSTVIEARRQLLQALKTETALDPNRPLEDGIAAPGFVSDLRPENGNFPELRRIPRTAEIRNLFSSLFQFQSKCIDHTWIRVKSPGRATAPHCDIVYHRKGSPRIHTIWIPVGDVPLERGPIMVLEGSNTSERLRQQYCRLDATEGKNATRLRFKHGGFFRGGQYTKKPEAAQKELGGRWLTAHFQAGDAIIFSGFTLHGALDNQSNRLRLSIDARYQPANEVIDPRWRVEASPSEAD